MNKVPKNFCILPFISIEAHPVGRPRPCCYNNDVIMNKGRKINFKDDTLEEAFYSDTMNILRQSFLDNKKPEGCRICWDVESTGGKSKRLINNEKFKYFLNKSDHTDPKLKFIDLKLGNICNLKCRICNKISSSKWIADDLKIDPSDENKQLIADIYEYGPWPRLAKHFWKDVDKIINDIYTLYFAGGEPFLIEEHFNFLRQCVESGNAKKIDILYNTNGTQFPQDAIDNIWPHFRRVEIGFSIDGTEQKFEYQRDGAVWKKVKENVQKFHAVRDKNSWLKTQLCTTVSVLNILNLIDNLKWAQEANFDTIILNILHGPEHFCIKNLSKIKKDYIKDKIEKRIDEIHDYELKNQIQSMINYMMQDGTDLSKNCIANLEKIDKIRDQDWKTSLPDLLEILNDS